MRTLTTSALLALLTAVATAQPPVKTPDPVPAPKAAPKPDPTDAAIAAALANDADVKMAKAKIQLAEAELAKARQVVTLRVVTLKAKVEQHTAELRFAEEQYKVVSERVRAAVTPASELGAIREKMEVSKVALATAEAELKMLAGGGAPVAAADATTALSGLSRYIAAERLEAQAFAEAIARYAATEALVAKPAVKGPIPDRIRAALDKPVTLGAKGQAVTLAKALEAFKKDASLDVPFRGPLTQAATVTSEGEELSVGAWLQLFEDHTFLPTGDFKTPSRRARFYVREYGVLLAASDAAPPDAPTLTEFWKQKPPAPKDAPPKK